MSSSLQPHGIVHGIHQVRVGSCSLLQGIFPTQGSNPGLPHCRQILYQLSHQGSPAIVQARGKDKHWNVPALNVFYFPTKLQGFSSGSAVKNMPAIQETWVRSLCREDPLEEEMATHSSILAWRIPWTDELGSLQSIGLHRVRHNWSDRAYMHRTAMRWGSVRWAQC